MEDLKRTVKKGDVLYEVINAYRIEEITFNPRLKHHMRMLESGRLFESLAHAREFKHTLEEKENDDYKKLCARIDAEIK